MKSTRAISFFIAFVTFICTILLDHSLSLNSNVSFLNYCPSFKTEFSKKNISLNFENLPQDISTVEFHTYAAADLLYDMIFAMISDKK